MGADTTDSYLPVSGGTINTVSLKGKEGKEMAVRRAVGRKKAKKVASKKKAAKKVAPKRAGSKAGKKSIGQQLDELLEGLGVNPKGKIKLTGLSGRSAR